MTAELFARSSRIHTDFFAQLCNVYPDGRTVNVCDLLRLAPDSPAPSPDGIARMQSTFADRAPLRR